MKYLGLMLVFIGTTSFAATNLPAVAVNCTMQSGTSQLKRFSLQVYDDKASGVLDLAIEGMLLPFPNLFNDVTVSKAVQYDGKKLTLEVHYAAHSQYYYVITVDMKSKTATLDEDDYFDTPTPVNYTGSYTCQIH